jgi:hypothetical protein
MLRRDRWVKWSAAAGIAFLLGCLAPWPRLGAAYSAFWCAVLDAVCGSVSFASDVNVHFIAGSEALLPGKDNPLWHVIAVVSSPVTQATTRFGLNLRAIGYVPTAMFLALVIAWPLDRRRSWGATAIGFCAVQAYFLISITLPMLLSLANPRVGAIELGPAAEALVRTVFMGFVVPPGMSYAVPLLIYAVVAIIGSGGAAYVADAHEIRSLLSGFRRVCSALNTSRKALSAK